MTLTARQASMVRDILVAFLDQEPGLEKMWPRWFAPVFGPLPEKKEESR